MPELAATGWRARLAEAWERPHVQRRARHLALTLAVAGASWAVGRLCSLLPETLEPPCHAAAALARALLGGGE